MFVLLLIVDRNAFPESGFGSGVENGESTRSLEIHRDNRGTAEGRGQCVDGYSTYRAGRGKY